MSHLKTAAIPDISLLFLDLFYKCLYINIKTSNINKNIKHRENNKNTENIKKHGEHKKRCGKKKKQKIKKILKSWLFGQNLVVCYQTTKK